MSTARMSQNARSSRRSSLRGSKKIIGSSAALMNTNQSQNNLTNDEMTEMLLSIFNALVDKEKRPKGKDKDSKEEAFITPDNLKLALEEHGHSGDELLVQLLIDDIDENGDGKISFEEFKSIMVKCLFDASEELLQAFAVVDDDGDGYISTVEFKRIFMTEGTNPLSDREADELMMFADSDGDGLVEYKKFLQWLSNPERGMVKC